MKKETTTSSIAITPKPKSISGITNPLLRLLRVREMAMLILILVVCVVMTILSPYFLSTTNFLSMARGFSMDGMVTIGMTLLLITGAFDLSVGAVMALSGIVTAILIVSLHMPYPIAVLGGLVVGLIAGWINGTLVTRLKVNALIATLGMQTVARGIASG